MRNAKASKFLLAVALCVAAPPGCVQGPISPAEVGPVTHAVLEPDSVTVPGFTGVLQVRENWCWAACLEMIYGHYGCRLSQFDFASGMFGKWLDDGATVDQIESVVRLGALRDAESRMDTVMLGEWDHLPTTTQIEESVRAGHPLLVGVAYWGFIGHAVVVHGFIDYHDGNVRLMVFDPAGGEVAWDYFEARKICFFCAIPFGSRPDNTTKPADDTRATRADLRP